MTRVLVVAGEASGDQHAAGLVREARQLDPELRFFGAGGDQLRAQGCEIIHDAKSLGIVGIAEAISQLPTVLAILRDLTRRLERERPAAVLLVDLPDFNLRLARRAAALGIPVVYYISPQLWAWRTGRIRTIQRVVRRMIVLFPFEESFYRQHGVDVVFSGHPLAERAHRDLAAPEARTRLGLDPQAPTFGLLPGSRRSELARLFEPMMQTARCVLQQEPRAQFVTPVAATLDSSELQLLASRSGLPLVAVPNAFELVVDACDAVVCASGTATLQVAIRDVPPVVVYKTSWSSYLIFRSALKVPHISLVNLIAERELVPELIQRDFTPQRAADALLALGRPGPRRETVLAGIEQVRSKLGEPGAYRRAAAALMSVVDETRTGRGESPP
jgi:lipid-A-disaccharide synthase